MANKYILTGFIVGSSSLNKFASRNIVSGRTFLLHFTICLRNFLCFFATFDSIVRLSYIELQSVKLKLFTGKSEEMKGKPGTGCHAEWNKSSVTNDNRQYFVSWRWPRSRENVSSKCP